MKRSLFICAVVAGMLLQGVQANAQQVTPLPKPVHPLPRLVHFPVPAAQYEQYVQWFLQILHTMPNRYHVAQSDVDKVILNLKECASKIESDGYVTRKEMDYCHDMMMAKIHEVAAPYLLEHAAGDF